MALLERIEADLKQAMKNKEKDKVAALRSVKTALIKARTEKGADQQISEENEIKILQKLLGTRLGNSTNILYNFIKSHTNTIISNSKSTVVRVDIQEYLKIRIAF